ncbi:109_t:CDS:1, partial [Funneliformis caledonium]
FDHIWSCSQNTTSLTDLIQKHKQSFLFHLKKLNKSNNDTLIDAIDQSSI